MPNKHVLNTFEQATVTTIMLLSDTRPRSYYCCVPNTTSVTKELDATKLAEGHLPVVVSPGKAV